MADNSALPIAWTFIAGILVVELLCHMFSADRHATCLRRRNQNGVFIYRRTFELLQLQYGLILSFGLFPGRNRLAQRALMFSVKRLGHCLGECMCLQIVRQHGDPRDGLQRCPMQSGDRDERENHQEFAPTGKHISNIAGSILKSRNE